MNDYRQSHHRRLFARSRLQLALIYAGVMGGILLLCGYVAHGVINYSFTRMIDRELDVLGRLVTDKVRNKLQ
ncbi:MAG: two-component sensor histidine kinase, partial [Pseudanabaenaceae cyanobacterium]